MVHILAVDLDVSKAQFLVTPTKPDTAPYLCAQTTSQFVKEFGVQFAINGDGWTNPQVTKNVCAPDRPLVKVNGFAASGGTIYSNAKAETTFYVDLKNRVTINIRPGNLLHAISGDQMLVVNGKPAQNLDVSLLSPRTALGISSNARRLILIVVDGSQPEYSEGVNFVELANLLIQYGAYTAMNLNGGSSSTMVVMGADKLPHALNSPIDGKVQGQERYVANHLGLFVR
jgi:exopolysaccharide biosynthesis protein